MLSATNEPIEDGHSVDLPHHQIAQLVDLLCQAKVEGRDGYNAARQTFVELADMALCEAWSIAELQPAETDWQPIERTIEADNALGAVA